MSGPLTVELENGAPAAPEEEQGARWAVVFTDVEAEHGTLQRKVLVRLFDDKASALTEAVGFIADNVSEQERVSWDAMDDEAVRSVLIENGTYCEADWIVAVTEVDAWALDAWAVGQKQQTEDAAALDAIRVLMDGTEWDADTTDAIARLVRLTGRTIREPEVSS